MTSTSLKLVLFRPPCRFICHNFKVFLPSPILAKWHAHLSFLDLVILLYNFFIISIYSNLFFYFIFFITFNLILSVEPLYSFSFQEYLPVSFCRYLSSYITLLCSLYIMQYVFFRLKCICVRVCVPVCLLIFFTVGLYSIL